MAAGLARSSNPSARQRAPTRVLAQRFPLGRAREAGIARPRLATPGCPRRLQPTRGSKSERSGKPARLGGVGGGGGRPSGFLAPTEQRPACRAPATLTFQGSPTSAPSPRSRAPVQGEARSSSRFSCTRGRARRPGWGEGHWDQLPPVPVQARCSRHQGPLSCSRPGRCSRARTLVPGRGRTTQSPRRRVLGRPYPEGTKRLEAREVELVGCPLRVSSWRWFPRDPTLGRPRPLPTRDAPGLEESFWRDTAPGRSPGGRERRDSAQSRLWYLEPKAVSKSTLGTDGRVKTAPAGIPIRTPYIS